MIRLLFFFVVLALVAWGGVYLVEHPGHISLNWFGYRIETSAALLVIAIAVVAIILWIVLRVLLGLPSFVAYSARRRRREKGYAALSRGLIAVHAGDARTAGRASAQASRQLRDDPLALMLRAQSAQLAGDAHAAIHAYQTMAQRDDTRMLGLRGLYQEAGRRGDDEAARHFAQAAHKAQSLPWTAQARLEHHATAGDWEEALRTVEAGVASGQLQKETGERHRAVLETALGLDKELSSPEQALVLARAAMKRAPDLSPAVVLAARLLSRRGDIRKASKLVEKTWPTCPHPALAEAYMDVRPGDSTTDRLSRARTLMGLAAYDPVGRLTVARAALANTEYAAAREAMEPLVGEGKRPTVKMCLLMAELEEAEHGDHGLWREWLARASRAALDPAWMADGIVYETWGPVSPTTGRLDAFTWRVPADRQGPVMDALPPRREMALRSPEPVAREAPAQVQHVKSDVSAAPQAAPVPAAEVAAESAAAPAPVPVVEPDLPPRQVAASEVQQAAAPPVQAAQVPTLYDRAGEPDGAADHAAPDENRAAQILAMPSVPPGDAVAPTEPDEQKQHDRRVGEARRAGMIYTSG